MYARRPLPALVAAALGMAAGSALAEPAGPSVVQGRAAIGTAARVTTVTPATASTVIRWQGFGLAPGDTARFNQAAGSVVFNQVAPGGAFALNGGLDSAGRVVFLNGSVATGAGLGITGMNLDLAALNRSALRLERMDGAPGVAARAQHEVLGDQALATLSEGRVFVLGADKASVSTAASGAVLVAPGRTVQLADVRYPNLRVEIAAPSGNALDLTALLARSGQIFASLVSARALPGRRTESPAVQLAGSGGAAPLPVVYALAAMSRSDAVDALSPDLLAMIPDPAAMAQAEALRVALQDALEDTPVAARAGQPAPLQLAAAASVAAIGLDEDRAALPVLLASRLRTTEEIQPPAAPVAAVGPDEDGMRLPLRALAGLAGGEAVQAPVLVAAFGPDEDRGILPALFAARLLAADAVEPTVPDLAAIGPDEDRSVMPSGVVARLASTEWLGVPAAMARAAPAAQAPAPIQVAALAPVPVAAAAVAVATPAAAAPAPDVPALPAAAVPARPTAIAAAVPPTPAHDVQPVAASPTPASPAPGAAALVASHQPAPAPVRAEPVQVQAAAQVVMVSQPQPAAAIPVAAVSDAGAVRLARVERRMPMIMIDRKGGVFHM
jgi:filamentous hemagglutinin family protein